VLTEWVSLIAEIPRLTQFARANDGARNQTVRSVLEFAQKEEAKSSTVPVSDMISVFTRETDQSKIYPETSSLENEARLALLHPGRGIFPWQREAIPIYSGCEGPSRKQIDGQGPFPYNLKNTWPYRSSGRFCVDSGFMC